MKQEDKDLLLKDLCTRLPYGVKVLDSVNKKYGESKLISIGTDGSMLVDNESNDIQYYPIITEVKPYLRPMSSMTEEELKEFATFTSLSMHRFICNKTNTYYWYNTYEEEDWLNEHHFDYRGLIEKGLALEAPKDMYDIK